MIFEPMAIPGVFLVVPEHFPDSRGTFARTFCEMEFERAGLLPLTKQCSASFNKLRGTLRGMHLQLAPGEEAKLVRCTRGRIFDVALDVRPKSPTFGQWASAELTPDNRRALYIPPGCAHGYQTLEDETEVFYQMSAEYRPELGRGFRWNDPAFSISWPLANPILSERDANYPDSRLEQL